MSRLRTLIKYYAEHDQDWTCTISYMFGLAYQNAPAFSFHVDEYNKCEEKYGYSIAEGLNLYVIGDGLCLDTAL